MFDYTTYFNPASPPPLLVFLSELFCQYEFVKTVLLHIMYFFDSLIKYIVFSLLTTAKRIEAGQI